MQEAQALQFPPPPAGRKVDKPYEPELIASTLITQGKTQAARLMRSHGYTIRQISSYVGLHMSKVADLVSDLPTSNVADTSALANGKIKLSTAQRAAQQEGRDRFKRALDAMDVEFFRGMDDASACNRTHTATDTLFRYHEPARLLRCLEWLENHWDAASLTLHTKVLCRGPNRPPAEWTAWWADQLSLPLDGFDAPQAVDPPRWHPVDHRGASRGILEFRYRSTVLTNRLIGLYDAKRDLRRFIGQVAGPLSMVAFVQGEV